MKKIVITLIVVFSGFYLSAQSIITQGGLPITDLVEDTLINGCIQVSNVTVNNNGAFGYFRKGTSQFPFASGIILASGAIANAQGPNSSGSLGSSTGSGSDPDLAALSPGYTINDATIVLIIFLVPKNFLNMRIHPLTMFLDFSFLDLE
jgi:proteasome assembly chaperone (PAC2) family protein